MESHKIHCFAGESALHLRQGGGTAHHGLLIVIGIERLGLSASTLSRAKGTEDFEEI